MARLRSPDLEVYLPPRCLIGRSRACDLVLADRQVSAQHAALEWSGARWVVRDLGSSNGTYLGGRALAPGSTAPVEAGAELRFGRASAAWSLVDASAPALMARQLESGAYILAEGGYLVLPDPQRPEIAVFQDSRGAWVSEGPEGPRPIEDRAVVTTAGPALWRIYLPAAGDDTLKERAAALVLAELRLTLSFTRDEEHVALTVTTASGSHDLKARSHHYALLVLARQRLADQQAGRAPAEQGWLRREALLRMLRVDEGHLNIIIHRARAQLAELGVTDAAGLIERRPATRELRLGVAAIELASLGG